MRERKQGEKHNESTRERGKMSERGKEGKRTNGEKDEEKMDN